MSYSRVLLVRWSRRDVLAVVALAAVVAFLTGAALFYTAAKDRPTDLASEYQPAGDIREFASVDRARRASGDDALVLPFATLESGRLVVGVTPADRRRAGDLGIVVPTPPDSGLASPSPGAPSTTVRHDGERTAFTVSRVGDGGLFPDRWYVARPGVVETLGPSGALVVEPPTSSTGNSDDSVHAAESTTVLRGTLLFFERGTEQVLRGFGLLIAAAGVLATVTVTSVVGMTVTDRIETIQVVRATGATPARVLGLFATRGLLLSLAAVIVGFAVGTVVSSLVTSVAVSAGLSTTLTPRVSADAAALLAVTYLPVLAVGFVAGAAAAFPAVRRPPAALTYPSGSDGRSLLGRRLGVGLPAPLQPRVLDWRAAVPTAATIAVFATLVLLVLSGGAVAGPLAGGSSATVLESGAIHPIASSVPQSHADAFRDAGIAASPEILLFGVIDDRPTIVRGARYDDFAAVTDAELRRGHPSRERDEAMVGSDLARTHGLAVGDTVVVGSGLHPTLERVTVVGRYDAPGAYDDQLLVPLAAGQHLSTRDDGSVNFVRLERALGDDAPAEGVQVLDVTVDRPVTTPTVGVNVSLVNVADEAATRTLAVTLGEERRTRSVALDPSERREIRFTLPVPSAGSYRLSVGNRSQTVTVRSPGALLIQGLPDAVPPGSSPVVRVRTVAGAPAANATVAVGNRTESVGRDGRVRVPFPAAGEATVRATAGERTAERTVAVDPNATRRLGTTVRVRPRNVSELTAPTATVRLSNPWNRTARRTVTLRGPGTADERSVAVGPGDSTAWSLPLSRQPRGEYAVALALNGSRVDGTTYRVAGGDGVSTVALRNADVAEGGGLGVAIATVFGNLQVIVGALVALAGLMVSGTLVASLARTIHARERTLGIYRATGASPRRVIGLLCRDGLLVGVVGVALGVAAGAAALLVLASQGVLVFFGIAVVPAFTPGRLALVAGVALALVFVGVLVPAIAFVRRPPAALFGGDTASGAEAADSSETALPPTAGLDGEPGDDRRRPDGGDP
ncbi:ABC transporter permease [Halosimplex pelagicum]|uniref:ABC transporter permease n=1 Tax=Halosimplex pelagicum TaxID=869886 RepID=A0A7D5TRK6_9EURY|nr:ABC transporter permease [Halosimplex pelagicum]QLH81352.1 ABC transporter permease [Halosimplex pelagicum]